MGFVDGRHILCASSAEEQSFWDVRSGEPLHLVLGRAGSLADIGGRTHLATIAYDLDGYSDDIEIHDLKAGAPPVGRVQGAFPHLIKMRLAEDNGPVVYTGDARAVVRWSVEDEFDAGRPRVGVRRVTRVLASKHRGRAAIVAVGRDGTVSIHDAATGTLKDGFPTGVRLDSGAWLVEATRGTYLAVASRLGARCFDVSTGRPFGRDVKGYFISEAVLTEVNGRLVFAHATGNTLRLVDVEQGSLRREISRQGIGGGPNVLAALRSGQGPAIAWVAPDGLVQIHAARTGRLLHEVRSPHVRSIQAIETVDLKERQLLAVQGEEGIALWHWDLATDSIEEVMIEGPAFPGAAIAFGAQDQVDVLAAAGDDGFIQRWNARTGELLDRICLGATPGSIAHLSNGRLVAGGANGIVSVLFDPLRE